MPGLAAQPLYIIMALRQKWAMADDAKKLDELTKVITDPNPKPDPNPNPNPNP